MTSFKNISTFKISGQKYSIIFQPDGEISFHRITKELDSKFNEIEIYNDDITDDAKSPIRVIRTVSKKIEIWVNKTSPPYFYFEANDYKKQAIYEKLFKKFIKNFPNYYTVYYNGRHHAYKIINTSIRN